MTKKGEFELPGSLTDVLSVVHLSGFMSLFSDSPFIIIAALPFNHSANQLVAHLILRRLIFRSHIESQKKKKNSAPPSLTEEGAFSVLFELSFYSLLLLLLFLFRSFFSVRSASPPFFNGGNSTLHASSLFSLSLFFFLALSPSPSLSFFLELI